MEITTLRLPPGLKEDLEEEAEDNDMSLSEYVRVILRARERIQQENTNDYGNRIRKLEERVDELEMLIEKAKTRSRKNTEDSDPEDVISWVREEQPVSRSEIISEWYPDDAPINENTWWENRVRPHLEERGGEFTRNVGWELH